MKVKIDGSSEKLFYEGKKIESSVSRLGSIFQNQGIVNGLEVQQFIVESEKTFSKIKEWVDKCAFYLGNNIISDEEAEKYEQELIENEKPFQFPF